MGRRSRAWGPNDSLAMILAGLTSAACGGAQTPPAAEASPPPPAEERDAPTPSPSRAMDASPAPAEPVDAEPPPPPSAEVLCARLCDRVAGECKEQAVAVCRASCPDYVAAAERCPVEVEDALSCQASAQDAMVCANVAASSCVPVFSALSACRAGRAEPRAREVVADAAETGEELPSGWARIDDGPLVVSLPLPADAAPLEGAHGRRLTATEGDLQFLVESPPRFRGEATDKALLKAVLDYLGPQCHKSLKVHGRFEKGTVVHVSFDTTCKDGAVWKGMLHVHPARMVVTAVRSTARLPDEASGKLDAMFYGLRFLDYSGSQLR